MEFSLNSYSKFLEKGNSEFHFVDYRNYKDSDSFILLRHDIDFSVGYALDMAELEASHNVRSTYLFDVHSPFYSALEENEIKRIRKIIGLGHDIGVHFDHTPYGITSEVELEKHLEFQKLIFEKFYGATPHVFSFHNPDEITAKFQAAKYAGMVNTYSNDFKASIAYCSDSGGIWRHHNVMDFLSDDVPLKRQILIHPIWWQLDVIEPLIKVRRGFEKRIEENLTYYVRRLIESGRKVDKQVIISLVPPENVVLLERLFKEAGL